MPFLDEINMKLLMEYFVSFYIEVWCICIFRLTEHLKSNAVFSTANVKYILTKKKKNAVVFNRKVFDTASF